MKTVTAKELKNRTGEVLRRVRSGETVAVTVRGMQVARFVPEDRVTVVEPRQGKGSRRALVRKIAGKYQGLGTVEEFLEGKRRETALEK